MNAPEKKAPMLAPFKSFHSSKNDISKLGFGSKWLFAARSAIFIISIQAAIIAGLTSYIYGNFNVLYFVLVVLGFIIAHATSNLLNDYFGYVRGHDTTASPRLRYTIHPIADKVVSSRKLLAVITLLIFVGLLIAAYLTSIRGYFTLVFLAIGAIFLLSYDAFPITLKSIGLGEISAFIVWGPLMIGSGYFIISGSLSIIPFIISIPYGFGVMSILVGKHLDQIKFDRNIRQHTLPVMLGKKLSSIFNISIIIIMYLSTILFVVLGVATPFLLIVLLNIPSAFSTIKIMMKEKPRKAPKGYVGWPLWYHRTSLNHNRAFGFLYIVGLTLAAASIYFINVFPLHIVV